MSIAIALDFYELLKYSQILSEYNEPIIEGSHVIDNPPS